jgi:hypothetical protein
MTFQMTVEPVMNANVDPQPEEGWKTLSGCPGTSGNQVGAGDASDGLQSRRRAPLGTRDRTHSSRSSQLDRTHPRYHHQQVESCRC